MQAIHVRHAPSRLAKRTRCPYCHGGVDAEHDDWVQCVSCRALEHRACWGELGRCATCRAGRTTADPEPVPEPPAPGPTPPPRLRSALRQVTSGTGRSWARLEPTARLSVSVALVVMGAVVGMLSSELARGRGRSPTRARVVLVAGR